MATIQAIYGAEHGSTDGLVTGNAGARIFDSLTGTLGTTIEVIAAAAKNGSYGLRISGSNQFVRWDTNTIGASRTSIVLAYWFKVSTDTSGLKETLVFDLGTAGTDFASIDYNPTTDKLTWFGPGGNVSSTTTISPATWYYIELVYTIATGTHSFSWRINGTAQTGLNGAQAADTFSGVCFGDRSSGSTGALDYDDIVLSITSGDYPLGNYKIVPLSVDPAGTVTLSGTTANFQTFSGTTPTKVAWNATTARDAVDEIPPNSGAAQDGWCQITTAATDYVEMPMTNYTLGAGEVISAARMLACVWVQDATSGFIGFRSWNGTTETNLFGAAIAISGNNTTSPPWVAKMLTLADINTQSKLNALAIRGGYSSDAAPDIGLHAVYVEVALFIGPAQGSADIGVSLSLAATGSAPRRGTANFGASLSLAGTGFAPPVAPSGTANLGVSLAVAASGATPHAGTANVPVSISIAATGATTPSGTANFDVAISLAGVGYDLNPKGQANIGVSLEIAATGAAVSGIVPVRILTPQEILTGNRNTKFYLDVLDRYDSPLGRLDGVTDGELDWVANAAVKGSGKLTVIDVDQEIDWLNVRFRPVMLIEGLPPQPLGIFLPAEAPKTWGNGRNWAVKLLDKTTILDQHTVAETYALAAGTVVTTAIVTLIELGGITNHAVTPSAATLDGDMVWSSGASLLEIINDLLSLITYFSLFMNFDGQLVAQPYTLPAQRPLSYEFIDGPESIYDPDFSVDADIFKVPNRVTVVGVGDGTTEALTSTIDNTDPDSPYSIANRGRVIGHEETGVEAVDQTALDAYARRRLVELTSITSAVEIMHAPVPGLAVNQAARFRRQTAGIDARHVVSKTGINLKGNALATSTLRQVVDL